ncbi:MAG TPA: dTMP kinase [Rhodanobacteraceae bacterium]|nr:dTMP kinase [Rhodanobacteraceae bacterium]
MSGARGRLVTLEGGEGAGKSTLMRGLLEHLRGLGIMVEEAREPGGTPLGEAIRGVVLDPALQACAEAELLLMFAARAQLVRERLQPALAAGRWVLCDRYVDASHAYQGAGRGQPAERVEALERWTLDGLQADLTLLLDLGVHQGRRRIAGRGEGDRIEREQAAFFERVRGAYLARAEAEPERIHVIDATQPPAQVLAAAIAALAPLLDEVRA